MATVVQVMARIITKEKNHPWKGLARSYTHYGTNKYYRNLMEEVGFDVKQAKLILPFAMASRFVARKLQNNL